MTSSAGGSDDHGGVAAPSGANANPPTHTGPAPAGRPTGSTLSRSRTTRSQSATTSANRVLPRDTAS